MAKSSTKTSTLHWSKRYKPIMYGLGAGLLFGSEKIESVGVKLMIGLPGFLLLVTAIGGTRWFDDDVLAPPKNASEFIRPEPVVHVRRSRPSLSQRLQSASKRMSGAFMRRLAGRKNPFFIMIYLSAATGLVSFVPCTFVWHDYMYSSIVNVRTNYVWLWNVGQGTVLVKTVALEEMALLLACSAIYALLNFLSPSMSR